MNGLAEFALGLGLFFVGMQMVGEQLRQLSGPAFRSLVARFTASAWAGAGLGVLAGAMMQSATGVTFILANMVASGLIEGAGFVTGHLVDERRPDGARVRRHARHSPLGGLDRRDFRDRSVAFAQSPGATGGQRARWRRVAAAGFAIHGSRSRAAQECRVAAIVFCKHAHLAAAGFPERVSVGGDLAIEHRGDAAGDHAGEDVELGIRRDADLWHESGCDRSAFAAIGGKCTAAGLQLVHFEDLFAWSAAR